MPNLATLMAGRDQAGADYALAAQALADAAKELKAYDLAVANGNVGGQSNGVFQIEEVNVPPHPVYLPTSPAVRHGVLSNPGVTTRLEQLLAS